MKQVHEEEAQVIDAETAKTNQSGWFKRIGWLKHLAKRNCVHLAHVIKSLGRNELKL